VLEPRQPTDSRSRVGLGKSQFKKINKNDSKKIEKKKEKKVSIISNFNQFKGSGKRIGKDNQMWVNMRQLKFLTEN
jgi:hypothetical protein